MNSGQDDDTNLASTFRHAALGLSVRTHCTATLVCATMAPSSTTLSSFKVEHLKRRAADDLAAGRCRDAWTKYTEALGLVQAPLDRRALLSNRSLAYLRGGRSKEALQDADAAVAVAPKWGKGHWRRGKALAALGRWHEATHAFLQAWRLSTDDKGRAECDTQLTAAIARLTRQQVADELLTLVDAAAAPGGSMTTSTAGIFRPKAAAAAPEPRLQQADVCRYSGTSGAVTSDQGPCQQAGTGALSLQELALGSQLKALQGSGAESQLAVVEGSAAMAMEELREACFLVVKEAGANKQGGTSGSPYQTTLKRWLQQPGGVPLFHEALLLRCRLRCKLQHWQQARLEAQGVLAAVGALQPLMPEAFAAAAGVHRTAAKAKGSTELTTGSGETAEAALAAQTAAPAARAAPAATQITAGRPLKAVSLTEAELAELLLEAQSLLADAYMGCGQPADAAKACLAAQALLPPEQQQGQQQGQQRWQELQVKLRRAAEQLSSEQLHRVYLEVAGDSNNGLVQLQLAFPECARLLRQQREQQEEAGAQDVGAAAEGVTDSKVLQALDVKVAWPAGAGPASLAMATRAALLEAVSQAAGVLKSSVVIEGVRLPSASRPEQGLCVDLRVHCGFDTAKAQQLLLPAFTTALQECVAQHNCLTGTDGQTCEVQASLVDLLAVTDSGPLDKAASDTGIVSNQESGSGSSGSSGSSSSSGGGSGCSGGSSSSSSSLGDDSAVAASSTSTSGSSTADNTSSIVSTSDMHGREGSAVVACPDPTAAIIPTADASSRASALAVPYAHYRLVSADGQPVERPDKHPFCMSRVYYSAQERAQQEVWFEAADGGCRWRQSSSEVCVLALRVPPGLPAAQLAVDIEAYYVRVANKLTGELYLEGDLERGIVPEESVWTHCGGMGEDGCMLSLAKMNLELYERHWQHSEMWWPRLFVHDPATVAWDDTDKDYSDLPAPLLQRHAQEVAREEAQKRTEAQEKAARAKVQATDDSRKRHRQERLAAMRRHHWQAAAAQSCVGQ